MTDEKLAVEMKEGFGRLDAKIDALDAKFDRRCDWIMEVMLDCFARVGRRFNATEKRLDKLEKSDPVV